jgi:V/A-type H+-transporting ATPase subunit I
VILAMSKARILGPRSRLDEVLGVLQDLSLLHISAPPEDGPLETVRLNDNQERDRRRLEVALTKVEESLTALGLADRTPTPTSTTPDVSQLARWSRLAGRLCRETRRLRTRAAELEEERALILKYEHFFSAFRALMEHEGRLLNATAYHVLLKRGDLGTVPALRSSLTEVIADEFQLYSRPLPTGETAVLVVVSAQAAARVEQLLAEARVQEMPVPEAFGGQSLAEAIPRMLARQREIPAELEALEARRAALAREHGAELARARSGLHDRLQALEALPLSGVTSRAFVIEGWVPTRAWADLEAGLRNRGDGEIVVAEVAREDWNSETAPVVLSNPRLLRPFEALIRLMPLPTYGSIDPTPFVAVFFPAFFGLMVGDIGYGVILAALGLVLHRRSRPGTIWRDIAEIIGPCAAAAIVAGLLFGEFFGDLGVRWFGLEPLLFSREEAIVPFLLLSVALGVVQVVVGLVLGVISARRHPRQAMGRGLSAVMVVLVVLALLAVVKVLPAGFFTPSVIALLIAFPVLILVEGLVAMIELLTIVGNILSYTRIMALGVASVMLAVIANRMVGAMGSVMVGIVFALLFHLVNFAIAMFSPTIHALRLHYVEFFGKFYSPGGTRYRPFAHWSGPRQPAAVSSSTTRHPSWTPH